MRRGLCLYGVSTITLNISYSDVFRTVLRIWEIVVLLEQRIKEFVAFLIDNVELELKLEGKIFDSWAIEYISSKCGRIFGQ